MNNNRFDESGRKVKFRDQLTFIQRFERSITDAEKYKVFTIDIDTVVLKDHNRNGEPVAFLDYMYYNDLDNIDTTEATNTKFYALRSQGKIALSYGVPLYVVFFEVENINVPVEDRIITRIRVFNYLSKELYDIWTPKQYGDFLNSLDVIDKKIYDEKYRKFWEKYGWIKPNN